MSYDTLNFVEGEGISVQLSANPGGDTDVLDVEISSLVPEPGADGQVLTSDSTDPAGMRWADPDGSPADDPAVWMPLTTVVAGVPELVWDGDDNLIPTLTPLD